MRLRLAAVLATALLAASCGDSVTRIDPHETREIVPFAYPTFADEYEDDDVAGDAKALPVGEAQWRTLYPVGDEDWARVDLTGGQKYEFSASHLSLNGDTWLYLYGADGVTLLEENDDCIGYDSCVTFTPPEDGSYLVRVAAYDNQGLSSYRLEARPFVDADWDGDSSFYDCADDDWDIGVWLPDVPGDGIDQNCTGSDALVAALPDAYEEDDTPESAKPMAVPLGMQYEFTLRPELFPESMRTITSASDEDWLTVQLAPREMAVVESTYYRLYFYDLQMGWARVHVEPQEGVRIKPSAVLGDRYITVINDNDEPREVLVRAGYRTSAPVAFQTFVATAGYDRDGDGFGTMGAWDEHDCDDTDPSIHDDAPDPEGDGIDQNCDGVDGEKPLILPRTASRGVLGKKGR